VETGPRVREGETCPAWFGRWKHACRVREGEHPWGVGRLVGSG